MNKKYVGPLIILVCLLAVNSAQLSSIIRESNNKISEYDIKIDSIERELDNRYSEIRNLNTKFNDLRNEVIILNNEKQDIEQITIEMSEIFDDNIRQWECIEELNKVVY